MTHQTRSTAREEVVTMEEAMALLGISRPTLYRYAREHPKVLRNFRQGKRRLFDREGVLTFKRRHQDTTQL